MSDIVGNLDRDGGAQPGAVRSRHSSTTAWAGINDIIASFRRVTLWSTLGWQDVIARDRRTFIGPFWQTLTTGIWVLALGLIFGKLIGRGGKDYPAYLAAGVILYGYLATSLSGSAQVFIRHANLIKSINNPLYTYALRRITENLGRLGFQSLIFFVVFPFSKIHYGPVTLLAIPGFAMLVFTSLWLVPLIGVIGTRYRDLAPALSSVMRFLFFTTPVFWRADSLGTRANIAHFNPFTHFLDVVRSPLLGHEPHLTSWIVVSAISVGGVAVTLVVYNRFRREVVFWL